MLHNFNTIVLNIFDKHAPITNALIKKQNLPWITDNMKLIYKLRQEAFDKYKKDKTDTSKEYYKDLKSLANSSLFNEKKAYFDYHINSISHNSKDLWKNLKNNILPNSNDNDILPDHLSNPNDINENFLNVPAANTIHPSEMNYYENHKFSDSVFSLHTVDESEIAKHILSIKSNAQGYDGITIDMVLLTLPQTLNVITAIINNSIITAQFPASWKIGLITPIPKIPNPTTMKDLRPISILPCLSKILEKVIHCQLSNYLEVNDILPDVQSGFRKKRGTVTALLDVTDNIISSQDQGLGTILTLLDFSRAFDCLNISLLLGKLSFYGLDRHAISWFASYLSQRTQRVRVVREDGSCSLSDPLPVTRGIPQGSILGPLLFIIYTADITKQIVYCNYHLYADDVQIYLSFKPDDISIATRKITDDLNRIHDWAGKNALMLNASKSKYIVLGSKKQVVKIISANPEIYILNQRLDKVSEARNLGIFLDSHLRFETHVLNLVKSCFYRLKILYRVRNLLREDLRIILMESLVLSKLNYGDVLYGPRLLSTSQRLIQRVQNACCRFCFHIPPRTYVSPFINRAGMLNMKSRRTLHLATLVHDIIKYKNPKYLFNKFEWSSSRNLYQTRASSFLLVVKLHKTAAFRGSFRYQATKCWNNLPPPLRQPISKTTFKRRLKSTLLSTQMA